MPFRRKDHYATLGVSRRAGPDELRRAYRRLAKQWHPDKNPGDTAAEDHFKELNEAYSVLSDPSRRAKYDLFGFEPSPWRIDLRGIESTPIGRVLLKTLGGLAGIRTAHESEDEGAVRVRVPLTLEDAVLGTTRKVRFNRLDACAGCSGTGDRSGLLPPYCPRCGGQGVETPPFAIPGLEFVCRACGGAGRVTGDPCRKCGGRGSVARPADARVTIPAGAGHGDELRVVGEGHHLRGRARGPLIATIDAVPHPVFSRKGLDITCVVELPLQCAWKGTVAMVPGLLQPLKVTIPPGTRDGTALRLRGKGMPDPVGNRFGDQYVRVVTRS